MLWPITFFEDHKSKFPWSALTVLIKSNVAEKRRLNLGDRVHAHVYLRVGAGTHSY